MPPIKRTSSGSSATTRKLAGHTAKPRPAPEAPENSDQEHAPGSELGLGRRLRERRAAAADTAAPGRAETDDTSSVGDSTVGPRPGSSRRTAVLAGLGAVGLVGGIACGVIGGVLLEDPVRPAVGKKIDNTAFVDSGRTDEVKKAATEDVQRLVAIDHASLEHYHETLGEFLTPELIAELDKNWPALEQSYVQSKLKVDAKVSDVGVSYLQGDRAEVLVVQDVSTTRDGQASGSTTGTYLVTLTEVDGRWKLSRIPDLPS